ncbi:MAG: S-layer homology domain-containing protein [Clostridia bacterium]|nr:S-layer homology domain-containing protein [Clostridia bacterium]
MKKILSLILAGLMTVSCAAFVAADDAAVEATNPAQDYAISFLETHGIYKGGEGLTNEDDILRYQMALFVSRISTGWVDDATWEDGTANNSTFDDIGDEPANKYLGALSYANQNGIIEGYSATKFAPYDNITYRDALTMVVRTLGYKGLSYPWGYIETAVELGLTKDVDAAYTDVLSRGEVAVIIYNAMFATTKGGETLAESIFGVEYGFKNIIIVATDEGSLGMNGARTAAINGATYVAFKIVEEDGSIGSKTYYCKSSDLGLVDNVEETELGAVYCALFTIDGDLATIVDYTSLNFVTVKNFGITDNEGVAFDKLPIRDYLDTNNYVLTNDLVDNYVTSVGNELLTYVDTQVKVIDPKLTGKNIGIHDNGNIMVLGDDGKWTVAWYWNSELQKYYDYKVENETISINWMSDKEFSDWYVATAKEYAVREDYEFTLRADYGFMDKGAASAYAKLRLYDIDSDGIGEIANYKDYTIGYIANETDWCGSCGANKPTYAFYNLENGKIWEEWVEGSHHHSHEAQENAGIQNWLWINADESVTGFVNEDGSINAGCIIYDVNRTTGEVEVVKYITDNATDDADTYKFTGLLQAYSTKNAYITVDGEKYPLSYNNLDGATLKLNQHWGGCLDCRCVVGNELDNYLMQYVTVTLVDGKVVDVDLLGNSEDVIVILGYAGVTSDGYIAVYGYSTADANMKVYKINSYNGWKKGDYRYYPANANDDDAFLWGAIYNIKSYDPETNSYGVTTQNVEDILSAKGYVDIEFQNGYCVLTDAAGNETIRKNHANDSYILVYGDTARITVNSGKLNANYALEDVKVIYNHVNESAGTKMVIYVDNISTVRGFSMNDVASNFYFYDRDNSEVLEAAYDDAQVDDIYLLGSVASEIRVTNLATGNYEYIVATNNVDLRDDTIYWAVNNVIIGEVGSFGEFKDEFTRAYTNNNSYVAGYDWVGGFKFTVADTNESDFNVKLIKALGYGVASEAANKRIANDMIGTDIRFFSVTENAAVQEVDIDYITEHYINTVFTAFVIYDAADTRAIVYIEEKFDQEFAEADFDETDNTSNLVTPASFWTIEGTEDENGVVVDRKINLEVEYDVNAITYYDDLCEQWDVESVVLENIALVFDMNAEDHDESAIEGLNFGTDVDPATVVVTLPDGSTVNAVLSEAECDRDCGLLTVATVNGPIEFVATADPFVYTATVRFDFNGTWAEVVLTYAYDNMNNNATVTYAGTIDSDISADLLANAVVLGKH